MTSEPGWGRGRTRHTKYPLGHKDGWTDLGHGVYVRPVYNAEAGEDGQLERGEMMGILIAHKHHRAGRRNPARWHTELLPLPGQGGAGQEWAILADLPKLTLTPEVVVDSDELDDDCLRGHITDGEWVPA